ncbi:MAG TPA: OmpA family protein [Polyangiaceae bacterium]|jgi:peptidoglycan-associated lipoprotein|nr:OmpA family protein [Polyangiaceae bacterium]
MPSHKPTPVRAAVLTKSTLWHLSAAVAMGATTLLAAGCGDDKPAKTADDLGPATTAKAKSGDGGAKSDTLSSVQIDDKILKACGDLPTARFAFDSADVAPDAANVLDALARCFISGPLKGKGMKLVGHADPRGETEYNRGLGQRRAGSISEYLAKKGVESGKMATSSVGEDEATGTDEAGWAKDRKVEILLAE